MLASVTCVERIQRAFEEFKPDVVFHSAAYKHVPMMEIHSCEAVYNNILGSKIMLETSIEHGVERFVLISTDKAVRPTNIMGTSKRVAELVLQSKYKEMMETVKPDRACRTKIMAVRFGNVIGSVGSVIPLFMKQIADGGPVTVTDARMTRYFMTINEAVQLILQAGAIGEGGEIFILKMGMPVKIIDMARDLIRLSGFEPDKDIQIRITGLRPGEKLYEELITEGEGIVPTLHDKIMVLKTNNNGMSYKDLEKGIKDLLLLAVKNDVEGIKMKLRDMVPEYTPRLEPEADVEEREEEKGHFEVIHLKIDGKKVPVDKEACLSERQKKEYEALHDRV